MRLRHFCHSERSEEPLTNRFVARDRKIVRGLSLALRMTGAKARRCVLRCALPIGAAVATAWLALHFVPIPPALLTPPTPSAELLDRNGEPLRELLADERRYSKRV